MVKRKKKKKDVLDVVGSFKLPKLRKQPRGKKLPMVKRLTPKQVGDVLSKRIARRKALGI